MSLFDLSDHVAIVTGGNGGIGLGMAEGLASAGATVVLAGRNAKKGEAAVRRIAQAGGEAEFSEVDVTSETSCRALIDKAAARHGRLDILVNNAGINIRKPPDTLSAAEWHTVIDTNLTSAFFCTHAAYPHMKKTGRGADSRSLKGLFKMSRSAQDRFQELFFPSKPPGPVQKRILGAMAAFAARASTKGPIFFRWASCSMNSPSESAYFAADPSR